MAAAQEARLVTSMSLSAAARRKLDRLARQQRRSRSQIVEHLVLAADDSADDLAGVPTAELDRLYIDYELREMKDPSAWGRVKEAFDLYLASCRKRGHPIVEFVDFIPRWEAWEQREEQARLVESMREMSGLPPLVARPAPGTNDSAREPKAKDRHAPAGGEARR